jgi:hypothetical protein
MSKTVVLAGVRTRNGMKVADIIALLALADIHARGNVWALGFDDLAVRLDMRTEIMLLSADGLHQGQRDRIILMPLDCARARCAEQPKNLTLVLGKTYTVFETKTAEARA